ncbi:LysR substrate-binding domain-containing protein [Thauera sp.]|uniref:LysR substrate-binding domain-containing protein n=1 Tax=Thauera sp. TaxID=1905334 RepID=UPI00257CBD62|nr:LysR substrate-binding domain-containing protein [Thauera sp.]
MNNRFSIEDLQVFSEVVRTLNFSQAAQRLGVSPAFISKRIQVLEAQLECKLFHRSTRQVSLTEQGEQVYELGRSILDKVSELHEELGVKRNEPRGVLRVSTSFGFGRRVVGESLAEFSRKYPEIEVRLDVLDHLLDLAQNKIDLDVRIGDVISPHYIAKRLARNHRILCAAPSYLERCGTPTDLNELAQHNCLIIKERDHPVGLWKLTRRGRNYNVKVKGSLVTNNGEIAVAWALAGHGIMLRSIWDARTHLDSGQLVNILPDYTQEANIWAVYPERLSSSAKIKLCVKHMEAFFQRWEQR